MQPTPRLSVGMSATYVGEQFNRSPLRRDPLDEFVRVDLVAHFSLTEQVEVFARAENLFDEQYQVILNAGTAGRSGYAGCGGRSDAAVAILCAIFRVRHDGWSDQGKYAGEQQQASGPVSLDALRWSSVGKRGRSRMRWSARCAT